MKPVLITVGSALLILLGVALFPFALIALLYVLGGGVTRGAPAIALALAAFDAVLLTVGAWGIVGLWRRRSG
jgi:hypothetical protein